jgi:hypothetical protein
MDELDIEQQSLSTAEAASQRSSIDSIPLAVEASDLLSLLLEEASPPSFSAEAKSAKKAAVTAPEKSDGEE